MKQAITREECIAHIAEELGKMGSERKPMPNPKKPDAFIDGFTAQLNRGLLALLGITLAFFGAWVAIEWVQGWKATDTPANALRIALAFGLVSVAHRVFGIALRGGKGA